jgi:hypothetical protein
LTARRQQAYGLNRPVIPGAPATTQTTKLMPGTSTTNAIITAKQQAAWFRLRMLLPPPLVNDVVTQTWLRAYLVPLAERRPSGTRAAVKPDPMHT